MKGARFICWTALLALVLLALLAACGGAQGPAAQETPAADTPPAGATGGELVQERCTGCHSLERVTSAHKTEAEWEATVERMRDNGAQLTDAEAQTVIDYLSKTYGP
jgi:cytochrome c5